MTGPPDAPRASSVLTGALKAHVLALLARYATLIIHNHSVIGAVQMLASIDYLELSIWNRNGDLSVCTCYEISNLGRGA